MFADPHYNTDRLTKTTLLFSMIKKEVLQSTDSGMVWIYTVALQYSTTAGALHCGKGSISKRTGESMVGQWLEFDTVTALGPGLIPVRELSCKPCDMAKKKKKGNKE